MTVLSKSVIPTISRSLRKNVRIHTFEINF